MTTDFDDVLNLTKKDFESKPVTTVYFIKDDQVKYKIKSNDPKFIDKVKDILSKDDTNRILFNGETNNINQIKELLKDFIHID
jgi:transcription initiation factor IIE alpha subunit